MHATHKAEGRSVAVSLCRRLPRIQICPASLRPGKGGGGAKGEGAWLFHVIASIRYHCLLQRLTTGSILATKRPPPQC